MKWQDIKHCEESNVYKKNILAGKILRTRDGSVFRYNEDYLNILKSSSDQKGIAYHLPAIRSEYSTKGVNLHPYFAGLLPEGLRLKALIKNVKTSEDDLLSILIAAGVDCIGDISVTAGNELPTDVLPTADVENLHTVKFSDLFEQSIYFADNSGPRHEANIPGVQEKISAGMISFPLRGKKNKELFILKLSNSRNPKIGENEHFFMRMAQDCGLEVAKTSIVKDRESNTGLLVQRFDRRFDPKESHLVKIHQEDACQFLDIYPSEKYRVSIAKIADGIQHFSSVPILDIGKLMRQVAFSYLVANGDLHAKNISIATDPNTSEIAVTPSYDIVSTLPFGDNDMALKFEGRTDNIKQRDFLSFGSRYGVRDGATKTILDELYSKSLPWLDKLADIGLTEKQTTHLRKTINKRRADLVGKK